MTSTATNLLLSAAKSATNENSSNGDYTLAFLALNTLASTICFIAGQIFACAITFVNAVRFAYHWIQGTVMQQLETHIDTLSQEIANLRELSEIYITENEQYGDANQTHTALLGRLEGIVERLDK